MTVLDQLRTDIAADPDLREVLQAMPTISDGNCPYARDQARNCGLPLEQWRQRTARLIALGLAAYGPVFREDDGMPFGSSYWLTKRGAALRDALEPEAA